MITWMKRLSVIGCVCLVLVACSVGSGDASDNERTYPYFTTLPSAIVLETSYKKWRHTLSPIEKYHFDIIIPKDWEVLDFTADREPDPSEFLELGVFRQQGAWMNDDKATLNAEISVSIVNVIGDKRSAADWLEDTVVKNAPSYQILEKRSRETSEGDAADLLISYKAKDETVMNRIAAFRRGDMVYVVSGNDSPNGYRDNAEVFYTAIATFTLIADPEANPFRE